MLIAVGIDANDNIYPLPMQLFRKKIQQLGDGF